MFSFLIGVFGGYLVSNLFHSYQNGFAVRFGSALIWTTKDIIHSHFYDIELLKQVDPNNYKYATADTVKLLFLILERKDLNMVNSENVYSLTEFALGIGLKDPMRHRLVHEKFFPILYSHPQAYQVMQNLPPVFDILRKAG